MDKDFTPITLSSNEEMQQFIDSKVGERLARAERKHSEATYGLQNDLAKKNEEVATLKQTIEQLNSSSTENAKTIEELTAKVKAYEQGAVKARICAENNIPTELMDFLKGDTEDELKASAEILSKHTKGFKSEMPPAAAEPLGSSGNDTRESLRGMLKDMTQ